MQIHGSPIECKYGIICHSDSRSYFKGLEPLILYFLLFLSASHTGKDFVKMFVNVCSMFQYIYLLNNFGFLIY